MKRTFGVALSFRIFFYGNDEGMPSSPLAPLCSPPPLRGRVGERGSPAKGPRETIHRAAPWVKAVSITAPNGCQERPSNWTSRICLIGR